MKTIQLFCLFVAIGVNYPVTDCLQNRIVNGEDAKVGEIPWIASIAIKTHFCGGSIISNRTILTAAHCVYGTFRDNPANLNIRVGSLKHATGGSVIKVSQIKSHPSYNSSSYDNDVALLITATDIPIDGTNVVAVQLASEEPTSGANVTVAGWGTSSQWSYTLSDTLKQENVIIVDRKTCQENYKDVLITDRMICASLNGEKDACQGDAGGPLTLNGIQVGIVSWGIGCAQPDYPGVYTNLANLLPWINSNKV